MREMLSDVVTISEPLAAKNSNTLVMNISDGRDVFRSDPDSANPLQPVEQCLQVYAFGNCGVDGDDRESGLTATS